VRLEYRWPSWLWGRLDALLDAVEALAYRMGGLSAYLADGHALCAKGVNDGLHFRIDARSRKPFAFRTRGHGRTITRTADSRA